MSLGRQTLPRGDYTFPGQGKGSVFIFVVPCSPTWCRPATGEFLPSLATKQEEPLPNGAIFLQAAAKRELGKSAEPLLGAHDHWVGKTAPMALFGWGYSCSVAALATKSSSGWPARRDNLMNAVFYFKINGFVGGK